MCSLFSITRLRSEPSRTMMDVTRDLIALSRPYFFGTTIFGVFTHAFSAIQIIKSSRFLLILFLLLLRLASRFQVIIGINSRGCVGKMLVFAYYFCTRTKCLILWISDSFTFVCITVIFGDSPESLTQALTLSALFWRCMDQALVGLAHRHNCSI